MKKYVIVGLGITGYSVLEYLLSSCEKKNVVVTDSRNLPPMLKQVKDKYPNVPLFLNNITIPDDATDVIVSPGILLHTDLPKYGDIELFVRKADRPIIALTGSNGKSTVTTLVGEMAHASGLNPGIGGNLGIPALNLLYKGYDIYILELSSFQLETTYSMKPKIATILNVTPDHMNRYKTFNIYHKTKFSIYNNAQFAVTNSEDIYTQVNLPGLSFGLSNGNYHIINNHIAKNSTLLMPVKELAMLGTHNIVNALAALAIGDLAGFKQDAMLNVLRYFKGLEHRCEIVSYHKGVLWINDSKGTNPAATTAALNGLSENISGKWIIILGGQSKNSSFKQLLKPIAKYCKAAILIGLEQQNFWKMLHKILPCHKLNNFDEVIFKAKKLANYGDGVLFSPACASFDMFDNYKHRGNIFKQYLYKYIG